MKIFTCVIKTGIFGCITRQCVSLSLSDYKSFQNLFIIYNIGSVAIAINIIQYKKLDFLSRWFNYEDRENQTLISIFVLDACISSNHLHKYEVFNHTKKL